MTDTYKVIQADRDAAGELWFLLGHSKGECDLLRGSGYGSHFLVQAFAKHREDTEALIVGWLRTMTASQWNDLPGDPRMPAAYTIADAIARGDHHTNNTPGD